MPRSPDFSSSDANPSGMGVHFAQNNVCRFVLDFELAKGELR
jgi:hypothetical protein